LETKFHNFVQGDLSVTDYCWRLKMADDLTALGEVITDRTLVLNVVHGLNERFSHVGALLCHSQPFPTFLEARDNLILEELTLENWKESSTTALAASTASSSPSAAPPMSNTGSRVLAAPNHPTTITAASAAVVARGLLVVAVLQARTNALPAAHSSSSSLSVPIMTATGAWPWPTVYDPWMGSI
jgi:hypothetical protein